MGCDSEALSLQDDAEHAPQEISEAVTEVTKHG